MQLTSHILNECVCRNKIPSARLQQQEVEASHHKMQSDCQQAEISHV